MLGRLALLGTGCLLAVACAGDAPRPPVGDLHAAPSAPSSLLRLARGGGPVLAYDGRTLAPLDWRSEPLPPLAALVGSDPDGRRVVAVDAKRALLALDLGSRKARPLAAGAVAAAVGPDGTIWAVDTALTVVAVSRRATARTARALGAAPRAVFGTLTGRLLALDADGRRLRSVGGGQPGSDAAIPRGAVAATMYGELAAVAADSGVVLVEPDRDREPRFVEVDGGVNAVVFSPSGHRLYVGTDTDGIRILDRFDPEEERGRIALPGAVEALRMDRDGRWLLVRPTGRDSVWVVDLQREAPVAAIATGWATDLPRVSADGLVAVRWQQDLVLVNVGGRQPVEAARVAGGADDLWLVTDWSPVRKAAPARDSAVVAVADSTPPDLDARIDSALAQPPAGADSAAAAPDEPPAEAAGLLYLQVSSSRNPAWANTLGAQLKQQGLKASVLAPAMPDEPYRVVLGPYPTRDAADAAARTLGMPSFVITVAPAAAPR